ncbi:uncharacterized protein LOC120427395 [Culex pipiens pallens]|uniref:uncharacterized protein LOC120427395 n=1 Tax=Culex pipiens pallens TaxID=42434 RepID=UPI001954FBD8|nr:uncharacterized protein LOC120427395 [Culex pipiens pallens]
MIKIYAQLVVLLSLLAILATGQSQHQFSRGSCKRVSCHVEPNYGDYSDFFVKHCPDPFNFNGYCSCDDGPGYQAYYHECPTGTFFDGYSQLCRNNEGDTEDEGFSTDRLNYCINNWLNDRSKTQVRFVCKK